MDVTLDHPGQEITSDAAWVARAQAGELAAFEALATRYERRVYSLAWRILRQEQDAEDVTQQTFLSVLEHLADFRAQSSFATWIMRVATHAALKILRRRKGLAAAAWAPAVDPRDEDGPIPHPEFIADWRESPAILVVRHESRELIETALARLDEKYRLVFLLRDVEGLSVRETAETLGIGEDNVKVRLLRARLQLREWLTRAFGNPARQLQAPHRPEPLI